MFGTISVTLGDIPAIITLKVESYQFPTKTVIVEETIPDAKGPVKHVNCVVDKLQTSH